MNVAEFLKALSSFSANDIKAIISGDGTPKEKAQAIAPKLRPLVEGANSSFMRSSFNPMNIKGVIKKKFNEQRSAVLSGKLDADIEKQAAALQALTKNDIRDFIEKKLNIASDPAAAAARAQKMHDAMQNLSVEEYVAGIEGVISILPPRLKDAYETVLLQGQTADAYARGFYAMTVEEKTAYQLNLAATLPIGDIVDAVHAATQKATPEMMKKLVGAIMTDLTADKVWALADPGLYFLEDVLKTAEKGGAYKIARPEKCSTARGEMKKILAMIEDKVVASGALPQTDVLDKLKATFNAAAAKTKDAPKPAPKNGKKDGPTP